MTEELMPARRYEWERIVRRIVMPKPYKLLALALATYADPDGSRIRPGAEVLADVTGDTERNVRRLLAALRNRFGLLEIVSRGGGRGGRGKASEYRLTIPVDLMERVEMLSPDGRRDEPTGHLDVRSFDESEDIQVSGQTADEPVDNSESPDIQMSSQSTEAAPNDRTSNSVTKRMTGHSEAIDRTQLCPTTKLTKPPKRTNTGSHLPAQPPDAREPPPTRTLDEILPLSKPDRVRTGPKCAHGLDGTAEPDGTPRCPLCRRNAPHTTTEREEVPT